MQTRASDDMKINLLVAVGAGNVIGLHNKLPWHLPADLKYFKNLTWGMPVVMGRKTFDSLGKPLPGRNNVVVTRNRAWHFENVLVAASLPEAITLAAQSGSRELFVIGGAQIFTEALSIAQRLYITRIHHAFDGDAFFPEVPESDWQLVKQLPYQPDEKNKYAYTFETWERNSKS